MRASEKWGVDVDTAVELALKELKLARDEVDVEILEESSNGFLGIGSKLAKVRVTPKEHVADKGHKEKASFADIDQILADLPENRTAEVSEEVRESFDRYEQEEMEDARASAAIRREQGRRDGRRPRGRDRQRRRERYQGSLSFENSILSDIQGLETVAEHPVKDFLEDLADKMGIALSFVVKEGENLIYVDISGKDTGTIIGKRGQTLDAVQYLTSLMANKDRESYVRVILDAENYRAKRERTLVDLANRLAGKVERSERPVELEPMNPYERKVIHSTLQQHPLVTTRSEGKDPYRRVIIEKRTSERTSE